MVPSLVLVRELFRLLMLESRLFTVPIEALLCRRVVRIHGLCFKVRLGRVLRRLELPPPVSPWKAEILQSKLRFVVPVLTMSPDRRPLPRLI